MLQPTYKTVGFPRKISTFSTNFNSMPKTLFHSRVYWQRTDRHTNTHTDSCKINIIRFKI